MPARRGFYAIHTAFEARNFEEIPGCQRCCFELYRLSINIDNLEVTERLIAETLNKKSAPNKDWDRA